jgi:dihydropteroate synthase
MGILNVTPNSFDGGKYKNETEIYLKKKCC